MTKIHANAVGLTEHMERSARRMSRYHGPGRELIQNPADAGATRVQVDGYKLPDGREVMRVTDNGSGMTPAQLREYMLTLFQSGEDREDNHGMGARFSTLPFNRSGVAWASRTTDGEIPEAMIIVRKEDGSYGSVEEDIPGEGLTDLFDPESVFPGIFSELDAWKAKSGTVVLLLGDNDSDPTWTVEHHREWGYYTARRWWRYPKGLASMKNNAIYSPNAFHTYGNSTWPLGHLLEKKAEKHGVVTLAGGVEVEWFVLSPLARANEEGGSVNARRLQSSIPWSLAPSGRCIVYGDEVWDFHGDKTGGSAALSAFGVWSGAVAGRVHLAIHLPLDGYVVDNERLHITTPGGGHLPWSKWGDEFARNMPPEIEELLDGSRPSSTSELNEEILKELDDEWARWAGETDAIRRALKGPLKGNPTTVLGGRGDGVRTGDKSKTKFAPGGLKRLTPAPTGTADGVVVMACDIPMVTWLDDGSEAEEADGVTRPGPSVYSWLSGSHLFIRRTHPAVIQSKERFAASMAKVHRPLVDGAVENAYGTELAAKIVHMRILARKGAAGWSLGDVDAHLGLPMTLDGMMLGLNATDRLVKISLRHS